jgi:hypothetical protein
MNQISIDDVTMLLGAKELQIFQLNKALREAQERIAELERSGIAAYEPEPKSNGKDAHA